MYMPVHVHAYTFVCVSVYTYLKRPEKDIRSLGVRVTDVHELPYVGTGILSPGLRTVQQELGATEPSLQYLK